MHSKTVGSSTAARIIACPGSYKLSKDVPNVESVFAQEGTMLHQVMEDILNEKYLASFDCIGKKHENGHVCTQTLYDEMIVPALEAFDAAFPDCSFVTETKVHYTAIEGSFGTADVTGTFEDENGVTKTFICDWKFGRGVYVEAVANDQILFCASAGWTTEATKNFFKEGQPIVGCIIQPAMGGISTWEFGENELDGFEDALNAAWTSANLADPTLNDGDHCKFCRAKPSCPVKMNKLKRLAELGELNLPDRMGIDTPEPSVEMSMSERLRLSDMVEDWAKSVKTEAHARLEVGEVIEGYKLVAKRATRKWDDEEAANKFLLGIKCTLDERSPRKFVSVPQAEKLIKIKSKDRAKAMTIRTKTLHKHTVSVSSGTTLAPADDKRPGVIVGASLKKLEELKDDQ